MNKQCRVCGYIGENVWQNNRYYCAACGSEIDVTQPDPVPQPQFTQQTAIQVVCPICKNAANNTLVNGQYRCALCGTMFDYTSPQTYAPVNNGYNPGYNGYNPGYQYQNTYARRMELESKRNNKMIWGIVCLFLFWPLSIYFFYQMSQISKELKMLG